VASAIEAVGHVDMIELDVHVLRGQVEVRHAKVLHPTRRLWERWHLLPRGSAGVPIAEVLAALPADLPLMIDLKCFSRSGARNVLAHLPTQTRAVVSTRNWWVLKPFRGRPRTRLLYSCGSQWQLWWVLHRSRFRKNLGVCVREDLLTPTVIADLQQKTRLIYSWGASTNERCRELELAGITGVILDDYKII